MVYDGLWFMMVYYCFAYINDKAIISQSYNDNDDIIINDHSNNK